MADNLAKAKKARVAAKGWVTRAVNDLSEILEPSGPLDKLEVEMALDVLNKRLATLEECQTAVEYELSEEELEADIEKMGDFLKGVSSVKLKATKQLLELTKEEEMDTAHSHFGSGKSFASNSLNVNLPKLELPKFHGESTEWQCFWDKFCAMINDTEIPEISKFTYLQSLLGGEAKSVIGGLATTAQNYPIACKMLKERYGRKERIIFAHIQGLLNLPTPSNTKNISVLWKFQDELLKHTRSLEALDVKSENYGMFLTPLVLSRLPNDLRMEWARDSEEHESDFDYLLEFLKREIQRRERSDTFKQMEKGANKADPTFQERRATQIPTASALPTSGTSSCAFCGKTQKKLLQLFEDDRT